ncbi:TPA: 2-oxo acid dehydrogenase subunit E2 [Streptococcus pneumoniae]
MADDKLRATPAARKLADDLGINLYDVSGSGANGRVHKEDVETYKDTNVVRISPLAKRIALEHNIAWQEIQGTGHRGKIMKKDVLALLPENIENDSIKSPAQIEKVEEVPDNVTPYGEIERIPNINASLTEDGKTIITHNYVNLAMAVGMDNGLMTPVVYNAEKMSLSELVVAFKDVIGRTLDGKLAPSELQNSTFTISNLGMFGIQSFGPIINQPNSAILGVSSTIEKPVVVNGEIVIRPIMSLGLTIDHRVVDGMAGAKFMKDLKELIETPISMLI